MPECPICFEQYSRLPARQPRTLFCGHSICHKCAEKLIRLQKEAESQGVKCPKCRYISPVPGQKGFPINHDLLDALDEKALPSSQPSVPPCSISAVSSAPVLAGAKGLCPDCDAPATHHCLTCGDKCVRCLGVAHVLRSTASHVVCDIKHKPLPAPTCVEHSTEAVKLYCTTCKKMICLICRRGSHQHHKRQEIDEVSAESFAMPGYM